MKKTILLLCFLLVTLLLSGCVEKIPNDTKHLVEEMIDQVLSEETEENYCLKYNDYYDLNKLNENDKSLESRVISCEEHYQYLKNLNLPKNMDQNYPIQWEEDEDERLVYFYYNDILVGITSFGNPVFIEIQNNN